MTFGRIGKYTVEKVLGRGSMGVVYLARDPNIDRPVAVKTIVIPAGLDEEKVGEYRERFLREARAAGRLNHPSIVTIYEADSGQWGGPPFIAMEYIEGIPWNLRTRRGPAPDVDRVADLARQIASALDYAHRSGVVHRDIKPANIIETADGRAKLMDFGIAKVPTSELTREGQFLGTPAYMSPEQVLGKPVDGRSDLFSLGGVLYEVLTGLKPFPGEDIPTVTHRILSSDTDAAGSVNREVPEELEVILRHLLDKNPDSRYASAAQVVEDLDAYLAGGRPPHSGHRMADEPGTSPARALPPAPPPVHPVPAAAPEIKAPPPKPPRRSLRRWAVLGLSAVAAGIVLTVVIASFLLMRHAPLGAPPSPAPPREEPIRAPEHLLAEAPKPHPVAQKSEPQPLPSPPAAQPAPASEPAKAPAACTLNYSFTTGIVSGEYWIRLDGEVLEHRIVDRDFSFKGETYSGSFKIPPGTHTLAVQVKTNRQNVNSAGEEKLDFPEGATKNLKIVMTKFNKRILFQWQ